MEKVNLIDKFSMFDDHWNPRIVTQCNGQDVKIAKLKGEFVWHDHANEDELFFVVKGSLIIEFRDKMVELKEGEMLVVPRGVAHRPIAKEECWIMLFEPANIKHTGDVEHELTVKNYQKL